jgi:DegV family protein with EDD domain
MRLRVVTDSSTSVPPEYLDHLGIIEVPASVNFGDESYLRSELSLEAFYARLATSDRLPTTSQPVPGRFLAAYKQAAAEGADEIIAVCVTSKLSGTLNSAVIAAEDAPVKVHTWDSEHASIAAGWQAMVAGELAQAGLPVAEILERLARIRRRTYMAFTPANLKFLVASGRVPKLRGAVGDLLNIKPIITAVNGMLEPTGQVRGQRRAMETMLDRLIALVGDAAVRLAVGHCNVPEQAADYLVMARARLNVAEEILFDLGPVLTALGGPGLLGLSAYALADKAGS